MLNQTNQPILITGSHRSGTTWFGTMLALPKNTLLVGEPFNICPWAYKLDNLAQYWYTYAPGLPYEAVRDAYQKVIENRTGRVFSRRQPQRYIPFLRSGRLIIKDPIACFSSEWLYQNFDLKVVIILRHPAAFAVSLKRMNWKLSPEHLLCQPQLIHDLLLPYEAEIRNWPADIIEQSALIWKLVYSSLKNFADKHPDWIVVRHEDLSLDPVNQLYELYEKLRLDWNETVRSKIIQFTGNSNPDAPGEGVPNEIRRNSAANAHRWRKILTREEIGRIYQKTHSISSYFYSDSEWSM